MADYTVTLDADFSQVLAGFAKVGQTAKQTGDQMGKGLSDGLTTANANIDALKAQIRSLVATRATFKVDSAEFKTAQQQIDLLQGKLAQARGERLRLQVDASAVGVAADSLANLQRQSVSIKVDANSIAAISERVQSELDKLQRKQLVVDIDSSEFAALGRDIQRLQSELQALEQKRLIVSVDDQSISALQIRLQDLQQRQTKISVDSQEFRALQVEAEKIQSELTGIERKRILINVDSNSITAVAVNLRSELEQLQQRRIRINIDSEEFSAVSRQIDTVQNELNQIERKRIQVNLDDRSLPAVQSRLQDLQQRQIKLSVDSSEFRRLEIEINKTQSELASLERKKLLINVDANSVTAITVRLQAELDRLQQRQLKVNVDDRDFVALQRQIEAIQNEIAAFERKRLLVSVDSRSITAIQSQLQELQAKQAKVSVDSREFAVLGQEITKTQEKLNQVERRRILINADSGSIVALNAKLQALQGELSRVAIGSQRFRELQGEIRKAQGELRKAEQGGRSLGDALQGIQSVPFLAGFASLAGVVGLFKGAIDQAVQLETITRKLSNSLGQQGAAGALNFTRGLADQLGLSFNTLSNTFGSFTAAATSAGVPMQVQKDLFSAVARSAQALGLSNDELAGSLLALRQVASKGTVQMEELRGQLGERLPTAFGATAKGLGITQQQLIKLVESGKLTADRFFPALTKGLNELTSASGGPATAAQNFQKLGNAWVDLQASFGENLLPGVTRAVQELTKVLEGLKAENLGRDLQRAFSLPITDATALAGQLQTLQKEYALTWQQAKNLLSVSLAQSGAGKNIFGQLSLDGKEYAQVQLRLIDLAKQFRERNPDMVARRNNEAIAMANVTKATAEALRLDRQRQESAEQLLQLQGRIQSESLARQVTSGQALLGVTQAIGEAEQARFSITKAGLELELKQAQARGAGEGQLEAIRLRIAAADREALTARFRALVREQELQRSLLALEQEKARIQANQELSSARADRLQAEVELSKAASEEEKRKISLQIEGINAQIAGRERALALLNQTQPLEQKSADLQAQAARAGLQAVAAQDGYRVAADGSLKAINAVAQQQQRAAELAQVTLRVEREVGQQRLSNADALSSALQAIGGLEQSRYSVVRAGLEFEMQKAQERGASEGEIAGIKQRIAQQDRAALDAKYQQLQREQELELAILAIKQRQQTLEAQRAVAVSALDLRAAQAEQARARAKGNANEIAAADALVTKQQILLQGEREKLSLTMQGQSAERAAVLLRQGAADNAIRAEQAAKGYAVAQEDSGTASQTILAINQAIAAVLQGNANLAGQQAQDAQAAQLYVGQAADGSIVIANNLGDASAAASSIKDLDLAGEFSAVASSMGEAATQAQAFYSSLKAAAALPGARWSGGPVEAGQEYRINELGQEAFLSAGRLSLIDAPANSIWRAPSPGVVIPAGVTARLQAQGRAPVAVSGAGGGAGVAELAIEVGKLRQEVGNLARRDWSVHVQQRTGPTGAQVLRRLL